MLIVLVFYIVLVGSTGEIKGDNPMNNYLYIKSSNCKILEIVTNEYAKVTLIQFIIQFFCVFIIALIIY